MYGAFRIEFEVFSDPRFHCLDFVAQVSYEHHLNGQRDVDFLDVFSGPKKTLNQVFCPLSARCVATNYNKYSPKACKARPR